MMLEILGGRVLAPFFGYSIYQWGALIGVVMASLAIGYYVAVSGRRESANMERRHDVVCVYPPSKRSFATEESRRAE